MSSRKTSNSNGSSRVRVHSKLTVVSSTPVNPGLAFPLSALDHAMGRHTVHVVFYYRSSSIDFDRIRPSLCELLTFYPNVTGRLARDGEGNWVIKCTDAGVRVLRAKVEATLDQWLRTADGEEEDDLTVWDEMPDDPCIWSPFRIQDGFEIEFKWAISNPDQPHRHPYLQWTLRTSSGVLQLKHRLRDFILYASLEGPHSKDPS
ncbi:hypothetical protein Ancab_000914 [Ancistrocladus abbreviatus]